jgi:hypothetical protein
VGGGYPWGGKDGGMRCAFPPYIPVQRGANFVAAPLMRSGRRSVALRGQFVSLPDTKYDYMR